MLPSALSSSGATLWLVFLLGLCPAPGNLTGPEASHHPPSPVSSLGVVLGNTLGIRSKATFIKRLHCYSDTSTSVCLTPCFSLCGFHTQLRERILASKCNNRYIIFNLTQNLNLKLAFSFPKYVRIICKSISLREKGPGVTSLHKLTELILTC